MAASERPTVPPEFLTLRLVRRQRWERGADGRAVVLLPRFRHGRLGRWFQRRLPEGRQFVRIRLDERGTVVWERADGETSMGDLVRVLGARFEETDEAQVAQRLRLFVDRLLREAIAEPAGPDSAPPVAAEPIAAEPVRVGLGEPRIEGSRTDPE